MTQPRYDDTLTFDLTVPPVLAADDEPTTRRSILAAPPKRTLLGQFTYRTGSWLRSLRTRLVEWLEPDPWSMRLAERDVADAAVRAMATRRAWECGLLDRQRLTEWGDADKALEAATERLVRARESAR